MLPAVVVQRLRLQSSKEQSLASIVSEPTLQDDIFDQQDLTNSKSIEIKIESQNNQNQKETLTSNHTTTSNTSTTTTKTTTTIITPPSMRRIDPQSPSSLQPGQYSAANGSQLIVDSYDPVTVLFCEIVNFTALIEKMSATAVITLLNEVYNSFDRLTDVYGVTKVEHIGNVYMVVGGCPELCNDHAQRVAHMSLGMLSVIRRFGIVQVRIGMHTGPVVGGIIGKKKLSWHLFGDTINTASRMASHSSIGRIQVSQPVHQLLKQYFLFEDRGKIQVKGKGLMRTFYLIKTKALDKRYTSIFSSLHREKPYIPPVELSEVSYDRPEEGSSSNPTVISPTPGNLPTSSSFQNRNSIELLARRERKGSIFASVVPPKVLNFLTSGNSSSSSESLDSPRGGGKSLDMNVLNSGGVGSSNTSNNTIEGSSSGTGSIKKKGQVSFAKEGSSSNLNELARRATFNNSNNNNIMNRQSPSPSFDIEESIGEDDQTNPSSDQQEQNLDLGKGIQGSNIISSNNSQLSKIEHDLRKHYTLDRFRLKFVSRDDIVEQEFQKEYTSKAFNNILIAMLFAIAILALCAIGDYFFLARIQKFKEDLNILSNIEHHAERYDIITGIRFGLIIPPVNQLSLDGIALSSIMMIFTISYSFSGIGFWKSSLVCLCSVIFFEVAASWKSSGDDIMLSHNYYLIVVIVINVASAYLEELYMRQNWVHGKLLDKDRRETEQLVGEILPLNVIQQMKRGRQLIVDEFEQVTIFLSDIVGFTEMAARMTPQQLVETLNQIYSTFDEIAQNHGVLKVATIGDAYLCVCGCPEKRTDHAERTANMAIDMLEAIKSIRTVDNIPIRMRIGIHSGPVVAGIVGIKMIHYQLWGESVQIAQQMESAGKADMIHISENTYELLKHKYLAEERPEGLIKNRKIKTYFLKRQRTDTDEIPIIIGGSEIKEIKEIKEINNNNNITSSVDLTDNNNNNNSLNSDNEEEEEAVVEVEEENEETQDN
eukprot:gene12286-15022_t